MGAINHTPLASLSPCLLGMPSGFARLFSEDLAPRKSRLFVATAGFKALEEAMQWTRALEVLKSLESSTRPGSAAQLGEFRVPKGVGQWAWHGAAGSSWVMG